MTSPTQNGYSLIELLIVISLILIISSITISGMLSGGSRDIRGIANFQTEIMDFVKTRQSDARRLNGERRGDFYARDNYQPIPLLEIDFSKNLADLRINGEDEDGDCYDDTTGELLTCLKINSGKGSYFWEYAYLENPINLPVELRLANDIQSLRNVPLISGGERGRGVLVTRIGFDYAGNIYGFEQGGFYPQPIGTSPTSVASLENTPFWAIYFVGENSSDFAYAIAVYPTGYLESYVYSDQTWAVISKE